MFYANTIMHCEKDRNGTMKVLSERAYNYLYLSVLSLSD